MGWFGLPLQIGLGIALSQVMVRVLQALHIL